MPYVAPSRNLCLQPWNCWSSVGVRICLSRADCHEYDLYIQYERPVVDVVKVMLEASFHFFDRIRLPAIAVDLGPASDAGLDIVPA
jgi:hypothetical protein